MESSHRIQKTICQKCWVKEWFLRKDRAKFDLRGPFSCYNSVSQTIFIFFRCLEGVTVYDVLMPPGRTPNFLTLSPQVDTINLSAIKSWHYGHLTSGKVAVDTWVSCAWKDLVANKKDKIRCFITSKSMHLSVLCKPHGPCFTHEVFQPTCFWSSQVLV